MASQARLLFQDDQSPQNENQQSQEQSQIDALGQ